MNLHTLYGRRYLTWTNVTNERTIFLGYAYYFHQLHKLYNV